MSRSGFAAALAQAMHDDDDELPRAKLAPDAEAIRLQDALAAFTTKHEFRPGMIVRQKPQAKAYKIFGDNGIAIVVKILDEPIIAEGAPFGSQVYRNPMDMLVGALDEIDTDEETFSIYHVDSRRFEPVPEAELALITGRRE